MKNKRIVASLVAALSSLASSLAVGSGNGGNVKTISKGRQTNINSKLDGNKLGVPSGNKSRKSSGNKNFLGKKRNRSKDSTSSSGDRHGSKDKNSANSKQDKKPGKNSGAIGTSKSLTGNKPVSLKSNLGKSPKSKTIIPHVPNGVTYGVGASVIGGGAVAAGVAVLNKVFKRSIFDKIKYGIKVTVQDVVDYFKKNTRFVIKKIDDDEIALLELDLKNGKKMFAHAYAIPGDDPGNFKAECIGVSSDSAENIQIDRLKSNFNAQHIQYEYDNTAGYGNLKNDFGDPLSFVSAYTFTLCALTRFYSKDNLKGSVFEEINFDDHEYSCTCGKIVPYIEQRVSKLISDHPNLKVVKFKVVEQPAS